VHRETLRTVIMMLVAACAGFVGGQLNMSAHLRSEAKARQVSLVEGTLRSNETLDRLNQLQALGYVDGTVDANAELRGVVLHDRDRSFDGVNLYSSRIRTEARMIDNDGVELHRWQFPGEDGWEHVELLPGGELLVVVNQRGVFKLDRNSRLLWRCEVPAHHDLTTDHAGDIYVLTNEQRLRPEIHPEVPVIEDFIDILGPDGTPKRRISLLDVMRSSDYAYLLASPGHLPERLTTGERPHLDLLHTNHVQVLDGSLADRSPLFRAGNLLISMRTISTIAILDPVSGEVLWAWGPTNLYRQHHPTLLDSGTIIVFDNGWHRSQIIEVDPLSFEVVWRFAPQTGFLSRFRGSVQRLPNGNTLITESDRGYVFEVTPEGDTVWRFANPDVQKNNLRIAIWRMTRYPRDELAFLDSRTIPQ
jgi:hypothetical protein